MIINFKFSEDREPQTYKHCRTENNRLTANIICPKCSKLLHLNPHKIASNGIVSPSVVCECGFHSYVKLDEWGEIMSERIKVLFKNLTKNTQKEIEVISFANYESNKTFTIYCENPIETQLFFDELPDEDLIFQFEINNKTWKGLLYRIYRDAPLMEGTKRARYQFKEV